MPRITLRYNLVGRREGGLKARGPPRSCDCHPTGDASPINETRVTAAPYASGAAAVSAGACFFAFL